MTTNLTEFARHDQSCCNCPGLFRSLRRGERKRQKLDITYEYGDGVIVHITGHEPLGADDMRILQTLVALAGPNGVDLSSKPSSESGKRLREFMSTKFDDADRNAIVIRETMYRLLIEAGLKDSGQNRKNVMASIDRLSRTVWGITKNMRRVGGFTTLSYDIDEKTGCLHVALNPQIAVAILGNTKFINISMNEVRALDSDPARLIHQRLCGYINSGNFHPTPINIDTLARYVWVDVDSVKDSTLRERRRIVRNALSELSNLGWTIEEHTRGNYRIGRPTNVFAN